MLMATIRGQQRAYQQVRRALPRGVGENITSSARSSLAMVHGLLLRNKMYQASVRGISMARKSPRGGPCWRGN